MVKNPPAMWKTWVQSLGQEDPLEREQQPTAVFSPGEFHEQRSLAGYTVHGVAESGMTEQLSLTLILNSALPKYHGEYNSF